MVVAGASFAAADVAVICPLGWVPARAGPTCTLKPTACSVAVAALMLCPTTFGTGTWLDEGDGDGDGLIAGVPFDTAHDAR